MSVHAASLESILSAVKAQSSAARADELLAFARAFYAQVPEEELALRSPETWAAIALSNREFIQTRGADQARIRVFNPGVTDGFGIGHGVVQIVNDDMSFLVDSVGIALARHGVSSHGIVHPVFPVKRDAQGRVLAIGEGQPESLIHIDVDRFSSEEAMHELQDSIAAANTLISWVATMIYS